MISGRRFWKKGGIEGIIGYGSCMLFHYTGIDVCVC